MKTKETKNFKKLEEVINHCMDKGDTLFAIFAPKNVSTGVGMFVGNEKAVANGLASMICHSLEADADNNAKRLGNAFLNAILSVLEKKDDTSFKFADKLIDVIETAEIRESSEEDEERKRNSVDCLVESFINLAKDLGFSMKDVTVEIKQKEKDKKRKSAKKDGKKQVKK